jgi:hypothetical protein
MSMTRVYKLEVLIVDHDGIGPEEAVAVLENARYPNRCINPRVAVTEERSVEWSDEHPLNDTRTWREAFAEMFPPRR